MQLAAFVAVTIAALIFMSVVYLDLPARLGIGHYMVSVELPTSGNLYPGGNVTYRGTEVGRVESVQLTSTGVKAQLSLRSDIAIPSDLEAQVHSQSAIGEQFVALLPRNDTSPPLTNGDVIPLRDSSVPPDINSLLTAANAGLQAIPHDNLKTVIDESYTALGGLGPEFSRIVRGSTALAIDARENMSALTALIDGAAPVLDTQSDTTDAVQTWANNRAVISSQVSGNDAAFAGIIDKGGPTAEEARKLVERLEPTLPVLLANLVSLGQVAVTYQDSVEQLLVLIPQGVANLQGTAVANLNTKQAYKGIFLSFNLNLNVPRVCSTGFLPTQQRRVPSYEDAPDRPPGDLYCRIPQDAMFNVRGARNLPCETVPGKRAPTVKMCESDEQYVPLNDGYNWKGDPNATLSGQDIPQLPPEASAMEVGTPADAVPPPAMPPIPVAESDPATGAYLGPDGLVHTQTNLAIGESEEHTWHSMLVPPSGQ